MRAELLYFDGCPNYATLAPRLQELITRAGCPESVELRRVQSHDEAVAEQFLGSPMVRVVGRDIDPGAHERDDYGLQCRLYRLDGKLVGVPPDEWVLAAVSHRRQQAATNE